MDLSDRIFNTRPEIGEPQPGRLLVAEPFLREYFFNHSIVYLLEYSLGKESMGLVMNRRLNSCLSEVLMQDDAVGVPGGIPLYCGGPVAKDRLFYLHRIPSLIKDSAYVGNGLYYGGSFSDVLKLLRDGLYNDESIRFFVGYSGWSPRQLEDEIETGSWATVDVPDSFNLLDGEDASYWSDIVRTMGSRYSSWLLQPMNPTDN